MIKKYNSKEFIEFLKRNKKIIEKWPEWKRNASARFDLTEDEMNVDWNRSRSRLKILP